MASVEALAQLQVPMARVRRSGSVEQVDSTGLVPGDVVLIEAGELVPADARIITAASLEVQEASLTGESAPIAKDSTTLPDGELALGDRTNLVFQNTQVTRGSAVAVVVATGAATQMGHIADMVTATKRTKSPLQRELDGLTKLFGILAWAAVAIIAICRDRSRPGQRDARAAVHLDGDLGHPDGPADVRAADVVVRGAAARRGESGRQVAHRRRDARRHDGDQQRQDRHADDERHDGDDDVDRWRLVQDRRWRLQEDRRHPRHGGRNTRLHPRRARARAQQRRHRRRRRVDHRRPDRGGAGGARRQDGCRRRGVPPHPAPHDGGAVRLRVQVHGDVPRPPRLDRRGRPHPNPTWSASRVRRM